VMKNKTTIVVAHRLSTIMKMDRIIVMDQWKIIEDWTHQQLLKKDNWVYKRLWDIQSGGFMVE
jgi:ATP-binding cassette subfamily B protein